MMEKAEKLFMKTALPILCLLQFLALPAGSFAQVQPAAKPGDPIAAVAGQPISEEDLAQAMGPQQWMQLRSQEYEAKTKALESIIRLKLVEIEAKKRGISPQKLVDQEVDSKVGDPNDSEVEAYFWGQNRSGVRFDDAKELFRANLKQLKIQKARQAYADSLKATNEVVVMLSPPSFKVSYDSARVKGDPNASVTIVEFSDFQCPFCQKADLTVSQLLRKYDGRVKVGYRDFPLREIHPHAEMAAEASRCAGEQGKFWEYHDALFENQSKLDEASLAEHAVSLQLNAKMFHDCLANRKFKDQVEADVQEGRKVGVAGTPSFFINGIFLNGSQALTEFEKIIDAQLATSGQQHASLNLGLN